MKTADILIINKLGLHARAAAKLVQLSSQFDSAIRLIKGAEAADAKSIMEVLMLAGSKDTRLELVAEGKDEDEAVEEIRRLFEDKFEEGE